jgi:hypothetical protein
MTPEEAMERRDALADRAIREMVQLERSAARDLIHDLLLAESDLTFALMQRRSARQAVEAGS